MAAARNVIIVGGGVAGVSTAAALRSGGFVGDVTLIDAGEFPYDRPPLSKEYLAGHQDLKQIALQQPEWYDDHSVRLVNHTQVVALRAAEGGVELADGTLLTTDRVVLATGGHAARPPIPGSDSPRVHVLRTAEDADRLREALAPGARVLVVGAGLIGAEVASTALGLGCVVTLVDPVAIPLGNALGHDVAEWLHHLHQARGITTLRAGLELFVDGPSGIAAMLTQHDRPLEFDAVVLGVGMVPDTTLAERASLEVDRGVVVDPTQVTSNPAVLAVGDPARTRSGGVLQPRTEHWEAAQHDGARAAACILGLRPRPMTASWFWTDRHGLHVESVGSLQLAEHIVIRGAIGTLPFSVFGLHRGHVVGAVAVNDSTAVRAARRMIDRGVPVAADRLADSGTDLRKLLRG